MSGPTLFWKPQRIRRGVTLTLVFGAVLATGAATGSFGDPRIPSGRYGPYAPPAGSAVSSAASPESSAPSAGSHPSTADVAWAIDQGHVSPSTAARLVSRSGDRWSAFYTPEQYQGFQRQLDGGYVGVGLWVRAEPDGRITVSHVESGSPSARAGIAAGDVLAAVDGTGVTGRPVTDVVARLRGVDPTDPDDPATAPAPRPGSLVRLALTRDGRDWTVALHRTALSDHAVTVTHPAADVTRIAVTSFVHGVGGQVRAALADGDHRAGVLLDLRGDSGGLVTEAVQVASEFLDGGLVATYDVHGKSYALYASRGGDTTTPLVVLVDGDTMSAAELLTGALQDRGRAVVVGSRTFGKGSVQLPSTLPDGSVAELTVGHYRTPTGQKVDGRGIQPDLTVPAGQTRQRTEQAALTVLSGLGTRS
jgi:carboxyl-terminal processing protease